MCFTNRTGSVGLLSEDAPEDADQVNLITKVDSIKDDVVYQVAYAADEAEGLLTCLFFFFCLFVCCFLVFCFFFLNWKWCIIIFFGLNWIAFEDYDENMDLEEGLDANEMNTK